MWLPRQLTCCPPCPHGGRGSRLAWYIKDNYDDDDRAGDEEDDDNDDDDDDDDDDEEEEEEEKEEEEDNDDLLPVLSHFFPPTQVKLDTIPIRSINLWKSSTIMIMIW